LKKLQYIRYRNVNGDSAAIVRGFKHRKQQK